MRFIKKQPSLILCAVIISVLTLVGCGKNTKKAEVTPLGGSTYTVEDTTSTKTPIEAEAKHTAPAQVSSEGTISNTVTAETKPTAESTNNDTTSTTTPSIGATTPTGNLPTTTTPSTIEPSTAAPPATEPSTAAPLATETQECQHLNAFNVPNDDKVHPVPTCTKDGYYLKWCPDCYKQWHEKAKALGHTTMETPYDHGYVTATCYKEGRTGAKEYCYVCQTVVKEGDSVPINPYFHAGTTYLINEKKSTCTEDGYSGDNVCSYCKNLNHPENKGHVTPAMGHVISGEEKATCCSTIRCLTCGIECVGFDPNNHSGGTETRNAYAAIHTCCTGYSGDVYCLGCGAIISYGKNIPATQDHSWQEVSRVESATEISITSQCTVCGTTSKVSISIG